MHSIGIDIEPYPIYEVLWDDFPNTVNLNYRNYTGNDYIRRGTKDLILGLRLQILYL